ncbi:MAG TPA: ABC transporter permease [Candidatus Acidoferrales bacterium]|nr:ABC transporter permease [Candidatus Acidoferrales bacterium]
MFPRLGSLLRVLTSRRNFEAAMNEELRFHIDRYGEDLRRSGVLPEEALRRARMEFGAFDSVREDCREARGLYLFDELARALRYSARLLRKSPGFTATALLTLALCLGANLAIFAVIDAILIRPLPFPDAGRLVTMYNTYPKAGVERDGSSVTNYYERRGRIPAFSSLSIYRFGTSILGEPGSSERRPVMLVSPDFFTTLGAGPALGSIFTDAETTYRTDDVAIVSDAFWREHFGADPHVIGRTVLADGRLRTIVGVLPPGFRFLSSTARLYLPLPSSAENRSPAERHSGGNVIQMIARLKPGATLAQAQSQIDAQNAALEQDDPQANMMADAGFRTLLVPLHADQVAAIRPTLLLLQAGVLALLAIGAVNLVNLLLIRASARSKELAVRQALGARRRHVVTEAVVETTLLTLTGGLLALAVGAAGIRLVAALGANRLPLGTGIHFDARLALVAFAAAVVLGVVLAAPFAWFGIRLQPSGALQSEPRGGTAGRTAQTVRHSFVVAQIALALVLLTGTGLLGLSLERAMAVSPGFQSGHVITGQISLVGNRYPSREAGLAFVEKLVGELGHRPGVLSVGLANNIPFSGANGKSAVAVAGHVLRPGESPRGHYSYGVGGDYFRAMGFSLLAGRFLTAADSRREIRVCVVDQDFARYYWPGGSALGRRLFQGAETGPDAQAFTVVGVVGSIKQSGLTDDAAQGAVYYPYIYRPESDLFVAVRSGVQPGSLQTALRTAVRSIDPGLVVADIQTMDDRIAESLLDRRSPAALAAAFSGIALLLIAIGTYGVLSYAVAQRRREIGVRMALGARPEQIGGQFLWLASRLLAAGSILGMIGAWITGQAMRAILFHVPAHSPAILAGSAAVIAAISFLACLLPARRAARISPVQALAEQ